MDLPQMTPPAPLAEQLYDVLERAIIDGSLRPGQRLAEEDLASHFGVSRIPIRETLRALDANGWVKIRPRQGTYVRSRSREELHDLFEVRTMLETQAVRLAALRRTEGELAGLDQLVLDGERAAAAGDLREVAEINRVFHELVAQASRNEVLVSILRRLSLRVQWYFSAVTSYRARHSIMEHARLVEALRTGACDEAAALVEQHISATRQAVEAAFDAGPAAGRPWGDGSLQDGQARDGAPRGGPFPGGGALRGRPGDPAG